jgi:hypothetical protein
MDKIQSKIGAVCINFETLDLLLSAFIGRLISEDSKIGAIMTADLSFSNLLNAFASLIKYKFIKAPEQISEIDELIGILRKSEEERNQVIHSTYFFKDFEKDKNNIGKLKITARQKKGLNVDSQEITEDNLKKINEQILYAIQQLKSLYSHLFSGEPIKYA